MIHGVMIKIYLALDALDALHALNPCWGGSPISDRVFGNEVPRLGKQARAHLKGLVGGGRSKKF